MGDRPDQLSPRQLEVLKLLADQLLAGGPNPVQGENATGDRPNPLSPRELEALKLLADGLTRAQIAAEWDVSVGTVHNHLRLVHAKLGVRSTSQAIAFAFRNGWLE